MLWDTLRNQFYGPPAARNSPSGFMARSGELCVGLSSGQVWSRGGVPEEPIKELNNPRLRIFGLADDRFEYPRILEFIRREGGPVNRTCVPSLQLDRLQP